ncbi:MAG: hypothetical protein ACRD4F_03815, partial [Candidatus Angelobacter sp.]
MSISRSRNSRITLFLFSILLGLLPCFGKTEPHTSGHLRRYYIAAEEVMWDFAPSGRNLMANGPIPMPF